MKQQTAPSRRVGKTRKRRAIVSNCEKNQIRMRIEKLMFLALVFTALCSVAFAATPPVYPGAKVLEGRTKELKSAHSESVAYTTPDSFEKVTAFYRTKGTELPSNARGKPVSGMKVATFVFKDSGFMVAVWTEPSKKGVTNIEMIAGDD
jgi:hypothetical protein